jgi:hypothetical protein
VLLLLKLLKLLWLLDCELLNDDKLLDDRLLLVESVCDDDELSSSAGRKTLSEGRKGSYGSCISCEISASVSALR